MHAELILLADLVASDLSAWRALAVRALEVNPFFEPQMVMTAAAHLADGLVLALLVVRDGGEMRACLPVRWARRGRQFPFPMLAAWRHDYSFLGSPLVDRDHAPEAVGALTQPLGHNGVPHFLVLENVGEAVGGLFADAVPGARTLAVSSRAVVAREADGPPPLAVSGKHRRELERKRRALVKAIGGGEVLHDLPPTPETAEQFLTLEASGWKGREGTALASRDEHAEFFRALCSTFAADDRVKFVALGEAKGPFAMTTMIKAGDTAFAFKLAVDEKQHALSPGVQLMAEVARVMFRDPACTLVDSCADPEQDTVNKLWSERRRLNTVLISEGAVARTVGVAAAAISRHRARRFAA